MNLRKYDTITFKAPDGQTRYGTALRYHVRQGVIMARVCGKPFRWEGGPPGEYLDHRGALVQGQLGYSDSLWLVPVTSVIGVIPEGNHNQQVAPGP